MKTADNALKTYLAANSSFYVADLYTITLADGSATLRLTSFQCTSLDYNGNTYRGDGPFVNRSKVQLKLGLDTSSIDFELLAALNHKIGSTPVLQAIAIGMFDGADVSVDRLIMPTPGDVSLGAVNIFTGRVAEVRELTRTKAVLTIKALTELLNINMPRNVFQSGCRHTLFDSGCSLLESNFINYGHALAGSNRGTVQTDLDPHAQLSAPSKPSVSEQSADGCALLATSYWAAVTYVGSSGETVASAPAYIDIASGKVVRVNSPLAATGAVGWNVYVGLSPDNMQKQNSAALTIGANWTEPADGIVQGAPPPVVATDGYFSLGVITFTSGPNNGLSRVIAGYSNSVVKVIPMFPYDPGVNDTLTAVPGCDKSLSTCRAKFANPQNFAGFPFVPQPESVV